MTVGSRPVLIMLSGRPASGKSYLARRIARRLDAVLLQTDSLRKAMFRQPRYSGREHAAVYAEAHRRIARHLKADRVVVFDATNLSERKRNVVYSIADQAGAALLIVVTTAPAEVVRQRLAGRASGVDPLDRSDATWEVYRAMGRAEPVRRPHLLVNTTLQLDQVVELIAARAQAARRADSSPAR